MIERQELYCHGCSNYVQFDVDLSLSGNHTFACPRCGHRHYRYVENGRITGIRWQSSGPTYAIASSSVTITINSTWGTAGTSGTTADFFLYSNWANTTTGG